MAGTTTIEWTDSTFNPWIGCTNISPACDHCYAEAMNAHRGWAEWGARGERRRTSSRTWKRPLAWNAAAAEFDGKYSRRRRVFCASLADVFDNKVPRQWRTDLFALIQATQDLDWQLLTKRPQNIARMLPDKWEEGWPNVWLGITAEDQIRFDQRWPHLRDTPATVRFVSYEPALGPLRLPKGTVPDWIISGGESGPKARLSPPDFFRVIRDQCIARRIAFFHKQFGTFRSNPLVLESKATPAEAEQQDPKAHGKGGALLDGCLWREFPHSKTRKMRPTARPAAGC
jgi:protein gp37